MKTFTVTCGGGCTFFLADENGESVKIKAQSAKEALALANGLVESSGADWVLCDDPEPKEDQIDVSEVNND